MQKRNITIFQLCVREQIENLTSCYWFKQKWRTHTIIGCTIVIACENYFFCFCYEICLPIIFKLLILGWTTSCWTSAVVRFFFSVPPYPHWWSHLVSFSIGMWQFLSLGVEQPKHEAKHSPACNVELSRACVENKHKENLCLMLRIVLNRL